MKFDLQIPFTTTQLIIFAAVITEEGLTCCIMSTGYARLFMRGSTRLSL